jgi:hypothetical protein
VPVKVIRKYSGNKYEARTKEDINGMRQSLTEGIFYAVKRKLVRTFCAGISYKSRMWDARGFGYMTL